MAKITDLTAGQKAELKDGVRAAGGVASDELVGGAAAQVDTLPSRYRGQVATASRIANTFNATNKQSMSTTRHIKRGSGNTLQLGYYNGYANAANAAAEETPRGAVATYKASLEYPIGSTPRLFTWGGAAQITAADGALVFTDEMPFDVPDGAAFNILNYQTSTAGIIYSIYPTVDLPLAKDGMAFAVSGIADDTQTAGGNSARQTSFATPPLAIIGWTRRPAVALFGDSRVAGTGDTGDYTTNTGTYARSIGKSLAYINLGLPSGRALGLQSSHAVRFSLLQYVTSAIVALGVNDYRTNGDSGATILFNLQQLNYQLLAAKPDLRIFNGTIEPYTLSSTDSYATSAGQTPHGQDATRIGVNETLRTRGLVGAAGLIDIAAVLESGLNTGFWGGGTNGGATNYPFTVDGLHAAQRGALAAEKSGVVNPMLFAR